MSIDFLKYLSFSIFAVIINVKNVRVDMKSFSVFKVNGEKRKRSIFDKQIKL